MSNSTRFRCDALPHSVTYRQPLDRVKLSPFTARVVARVDALDARLAASLPVTVPEHVRLRMLAAMFRYEQIEADQPSEAWLFAMRCWLEATGRALIAEPVPYVPTGRA